MEQAAILLLCLAASMLSADLSNCSQASDSMQITLQELKAKLSQKDDRVYRIETKLQKLEDLIKILITSAKDIQRRNNNINQLDLHINARAYSVDSQNPPQQQESDKNFLTQIMQNPQYIETSLKPCDNNIVEKQNKLDRINCTRRLQKTTVTHQTVQELDSRIRLLEERTSKYSEDINKELHLRDAAIAELEKQVAAQEGIKNKTNEMVATLQNEVATYKNERNFLMQNITDISKELLLRGATIARLEKQVAAQENVKNETNELIAALRQQAAAHRNERNLLTQNITGLTLRADVLHTRHEDLQACLSSLLSRGQVLIHSFQLGACINNTNFSYPADCSSIYRTGERRSGVYLIRPTSSPQPFRVRCEMTDGGWTVLMRRYDGSVDFYLNWTEYKSGFGTLETEFWLGNDRIHEISSQGNYTLRVEFTHWSDNSSYLADYQTFRVDSEADNYRLHVGGYSGNATRDSLRRHNNQMFSTRDRDNDGAGGSCAQQYQGAWWYYACLNSQLTGRYPPTCPFGTCMAWHSGSRIEPLRAASMKVKPSI